MGFKDQLQTDLSVFINPNEFAESATIKTKGKTATLPVLEDTDRIREMQAAAYDGLTAGQITLFVKTADWIAEFDDLPKSGDKIIYNGKWRTIDDVNDNEGALELVLSEAGA